MNKTFKKSREVESSSHIAPVLLKLKEIFVTLHLGASNIARFDKAMGEDMRASASNVSLKLLNQFGKGMEKISDV